MSELVEYRQEGFVVTLTLADPKRRNGLSPDMVEALLAALKRMSTDRDVRCAILTGSGSVFSAGGDPKRMLAPGLYQDMTALELRRFYANGIQRLPLALRALEVPIIAAVNGPAVGAGCDLACYCDLRIASESASFAASFVKLGLVPGDGGAWILPRIIGAAHAAEMLLSGDALDAVTALQIGLVSAVASPEELLSVAARRAARIAANPPHAVALSKRLMAESQALGLPAALELAGSLQALCHKMSDHREAVTALIEKRAPNFTGQ